MGLLGDLKKSVNIIEQCTEAIQTEAIDISSIVNKSVLLLDEFQDVNEQEWRLIQTIVKAAGNIRVIAVGDDDQNIYAFRGSSNRYMHEFLVQYGATKYSLIKNYRSSNRIVVFNNHWLRRIKDRLKTDSLEAVYKGESNKIRIVRYTSKHLEQPLIKMLIADDYTGTRAVLVRTNEEALLMNTFLKDAGQKTKLITGLSGFSLDHLLELQTFTKYLNSNKNESGLILKEAWNNAKRHFHSIHESSLYYTMCKAIILKFEHAYPKHRQLIVWYEYLREIKMEDAINPEKNVIIVSTMHKSKGKEFDHVYLQLDMDILVDDESKRIFYVACSRAKSNLQIHSNKPYFDQAHSTIVNHLKYEGKTYQPSHFEIILDHKDINLSSQKFHTRQRTIKQLQSGEELLIGGVQFDSGFAKGLDTREEMNILLFSKNFLVEKHDKYSKKGYQLTAGTVEYLVYWYDLEEDKEYLIVLPRVRFEKVYID